ncbi:hypothetical protein KSS87_007688 [Heliosperma pusillum]|nr:hypothetical protein KSS87_007688 [Heliosperma pusillum]
MSLLCFNTHCSIVTPCVKNESSLLHYPLLIFNSLCEQPVFLASLPIVAL